MELNILYTYDYGIPNHTCDSGSSVSATFINAQDAINYCINAIHQAYHEGGDIYQDSNICAHGHDVQFIIMEVVRYNAGPHDDDDPLVETFDIFNHNRAYNQMVQEFCETQDGVNRISEFFN